MITNLIINQSNLHLLLPSKMSWLASMLADDENISVVEAIKKLYSSDIYKRLENERTKVWHYGPVALYEEYCLSKRSEESLMAEE